MTPFFSTVQRISLVFLSSALTLVTLLEKEKALVSFTAMSIASVLLLPPLI